ncbi:MAG: hypothetical protein QG635_2351 [Bacteroidota bacterium]|nr:hypothetical protein [Bacteroidota bacterium]
MGVTWKMVTHWYGGYNKPFVHADHHDLVFEPDGKTLLAGHDGGIDKTADQGVSWTNLTDGMSITQYYSISVSATNPDIIFAGSQDNGSNLYDGSSWKNALSGDGMDCIVHSKNPKIMIGSQYNGQFQRSVDGGTSFSRCLDSTITHESASWVAPVAMDPTNPNNMYTGFKNIWKSVNAGENWSKVSSFTGYQTITTISVAPSDGNYIYAATDNKLVRSTDGGATWNNFTTTYSTNISSIAIDPNNPNKFWIAIGNYFNKAFKVLYFDGSSWQNITGNLPNVSINSIIYQNNSPSRLYIGTDIGVFMTDYNSGVWDIYGEGMPNVIITELNINYTNKKLYVSTYGRGIWKIDINDCNLPSPEVTVTGNLQFCEGDSVTLESVGDYPKYLWSNGETTKKIVIKESGNYALIIEDASGCTSKSPTYNVNVLSIPPVKITPGAGYPLCDGDTVINISLSAPLGYTSYLWSNGDTTRATQITQLGKISVKVTSSNGCERTSDDFEIKYLPKPAKPTISLVNWTTLVSSEAFSYQWYFNSKRITLANKQFYAFKDTGNYTVEISDSAGCKTMSDPYYLASSVEDESDADNYLTIYPNPGAGIYELLLKSGQQGIIELTISNIYGSKVYESANYSADEYFHSKLNLESVSNGVYFVTVRINGKLFKAKLIKE